MNESTMPHFTTKDGESHPNVGAFIRAMDEAYKTSDIRSQTTSVGAHGVRYTWRDAKNGRTYVLDIMRGG
jgi:hypothetical protein